eukprot:2593973-Prymnesium_polylepis.1
MVGAHVDPQDDDTVGGMLRSALDFNPAYLIKDACRTTINCDGVCLSINVQSTNSRHQSTLSGTSSRISPQEGHFACIGLGSRFSNHPLLLLPREHHPDEGLSDRARSYPWMV